MNAARPAPVTLMALDFGARRIGVAVGNALINTTNPLTTVNNPAGDVNWQAVSQLVDEWQPDLIIVGLPLMLDGKPSGNAPVVEAFAVELRERSGRNVLLVDEKLSSTEAREQLRDARKDGLRGRTQSGDIDKFAAEVILRSWLNERDAEDDSPHRHPPDTCD